jgi:hypothetical protein
MAHIPGGLTVFARVAAAPRRPVQSAGVCPVWGVGWLYAKHLSFEIECGNFPKQATVPKT